MYQSQNIIYNNNFQMQYLVKQGVGKSKYLLSVYYVTGSVLSPLMY